MFISAIRYDIVNGAPSSGIWTKLSPEMSMQCGGAPCWPINAVIVQNLCLITTTVAPYTATTTLSSSSTEQTTSISNIQTSSNLTCIDFNLILNINMMKFVQIHPKSILSLKTMFFIFCLRRDDLNF